MLLKFGNHAVLGDCASIAHCPFLQVEYDNYQSSRADIIDATLNGLSRDIIEMASTHPAAKQIVNEFKIQLVNPPADKVAEESSSSPSAGKTK